MTNSYNMFKQIVILFLLFAGANVSWAQSPTPTGTSCADAIPFCTGTNYVFPNVTGTTAPVGPNYGCLGGQPNPVWYYMKIANPGTLQIGVSQVGANNQALDVDFAMWGPFNSLSDGCSAIFGTTPAFPLQCSFSSSNTETIGIGLPGGTGTGASTPPAALTGQYYIVLFTNWSLQPGTLSFSQTAGTATTDCSIITCGVTLESNSPVCDNDTLKLTLTNTNDTSYVYNYIWTGPNGYTSTDKNPVITGFPQGTHTFSVDAIATLPNNAGYDTCTETIQVVINPTYHTELTEYICAGDSVLIHDIYRSVAGIYDSMHVTEHGCDSLISTKLIVVARPTKIQMLDSLVVCQYDSVPLESNTLPYSNNYTYSWFPTTNLNASDTPNVWFLADQSRRYVLTVTNTDVISCSLRDTIEVIVNPGDFLEVPVTEYAICVGDSIQFNAEGATSYKWSPALYLNDANIKNPIAKPEANISYQLIGTSDKNCTDTQVVKVTVHPSAVLELPDFVNIYPGETYFMQPGTNAVYFHWFPDAGLNNPNIANPKMNPTVNTRYFVTAKTDFGCEVTDSVDVFVKETVLDMPNAFNPNYENFKVSIRGIASIESFQIYNRWGQMVFETKNISEGWNGYFNGVAQPSGVYIYQINAKTKEGTTFKKTGNVSLIR